MPVSFVLAMFVLPIAIITTAVFLAELGRRADRNERKDNR